MKKILSILLVSTLVLFTFSCEDEDKDRLNVAQISGGAILRTLDEQGGSVNITDPAVSNKTVKVEFDDFKDQNTLESVDYYVEFVDATPIDNVLLEVPEVLVGNIPASAFTSEDGKLVSTIQLNMADALTALGLTSDDLYGGDIFLLRLALNTTDGIVYTSTNVGTKIQTSSAFKSPFRYSSVVVCPPPAGDWKIDLQDSYGDGWNGAALSITVNDDTTDYTIAGGSEASFIINVPPGSAALVFKFVSGAWDSEITYQITSPDDVVVADDGPTPTVGPVVLSVDFCAP